MSRDLVSLSCSSAGNRRNPATGQVGYQQIFSKVGCCAKALEIFLTTNATPAAAEVPAGGLGRRSPQKNTACPLIRRRNELPSPQLPFTPSPPAPVAGEDVGLVPLF